MVDPIITPLVLGALAVFAASAIEEIARLSVSWILTYFRNVAARRAYDRDSIDASVEVALRGGGKGYRVVRVVNGSVVEGTTVRPRSIDPQVAAQHRTAQVVRWLAN
ncbi:hypothetical protein [Frankia sp. AgKG'84/4]|uniref:hypothetical protein n=1 Tax=Frankia sp. AgKG'84/4 TaxID=573490 RepID=UPI00200EEE1A|nr:hypothetical protein [Frankia sp. AgKG'84/4]MCL9796495.1 hypothetical protein [Frankia sp. AgKG'84/4]